MTDHSSNTSKMTTTSLQERFITNNIDDTFFNNDDFNDIGNRDYTSAGYGGYRGGYRGPGVYRGHLSHQRPIVIIQPPRVSQEVEDPFLEGLTSLLPLAYLLPLALLLSPTTTVGRRRRREADATDVDDDDVPLPEVLVSQCAERLSCVSRDLTSRLTRVERNLATRLASLLLDNKHVPPQRRQRIQSAGLWAGKYPGHCSAFNCRLP